MENEYILGLDMGPTSIGWATVSCDGAHKPIDLLDANSRIFLSMLDSEGKVTKNKNRRDKRGMRKLLRRYRARRDELILLLVANGMLPGNIRNPGDWVSAQNADPKTLPESWSAFQRLNPFTCRENALTTEVSLHAMGRLLLHIAKRRGYRSNRGAKYVRLIEYLKNENLSLTVSEDDEVLDKETNSGDDTANSIEKETTTVLGGIRVLQEHLKKSTDGQLETAAQFVNRYAKECGHLNTLRPHSISISETNTLTRGKKKGTDKETEYRLFVNRKMIEDEFERIWRAQSGFLAISLSKSTAEIADLRRSIHAAIFFQRELKLQKNTVGMCSVLISRKRAPTALLESQDFLILQDLNHLRYGQVIEDDRKKQSSIRRHSARPTKFLAPPQPLGAKEREKVLETLSDPMTLNAHDCLTWDKLRTILGLGSSYRFSHEISPLKAESGEHLKLSKSGVTGNKTALAIGRTIPKIWHELPYGTNPGATQASASGAAPISRATRRQLVEDLLTIHDKVALFDRLRGYSERSSSPWHFSDKEALALTTLELTPAYIKHCERVLTEILPLLHEGAIYSDAIARTKQTLLKPKTNGIKAAGDETFPKLGPPPNIANPIVQKALYETRAVINKLIERQGRKPALIRIELGRDLRNSKKHRAEIQIQQNKNLALNEKAKTEIRHWNKSHPTQQIEISNDPSVKMVRLMIEQEYTCIFSYSDQSHQRTIGMRDIADSAVDICHIYPRGISGMDGYGNKVLAFRSENSYMGKRTPFQAWGHSDPEKYDVIVKRAEKWFSDDGPLQAKLKKIKNKASVQRFAEEMNDFTDAQLSDTRYIATAVRSYVLTLGYQEHQVQVVTGRSTATARRLWGLNSALPKLLSDAQPKIAGTSDKSTVESEEADETVDDTAKKAPKKDRRDHRHHAVDAIVIALTDIKLLKNILARYQYFDERGHFSNQRLHCPISDIQSKTAAITHRNVVSHSPKRKIWDALHADMPFGRATIVSDFIERKKKVGGDIKCTFERLTKDDGHEILWGAPDRDRAWLHDSLVRHSSVRLKVEQHQLVIDGQ